MLLIVIALASTVVGVTPRPAEAVTQYGFRQFNMAGWTYNSGTLAVSDWTANQTVSTSPWPAMLTTNEMCSNQYDRLRTKLVNATYGYVSARYIVRDSTKMTSAQINAGCTWFGIAVFHRGTSYNDVIRHPYSTQDSGDLSTRGVVCGRMYYGGGDQVGCSTHLDAPEGSTIAKSQADELAWNMNVWWQPYRRFIGGDFNLSPGVSELTIFYDQYFEADGQQRDLTPATTNSGLRIDYIWGRTPFVTSVSLPASTVATSYSDHRYYGGRFGW